MDQKHSDSQESASNLWGLCAFVVVLVIAILLSWLQPTLSDIQHFYHRRHFSFILCFIAIILAIGIVAICHFRNQFIEKREPGLVTQDSPDSIFFGIEKRGKKAIYHRESIRAMHTQLIGTTNAGKTASVVLPWITQDMRAGRGMVIIDGKSDRSFLDQLYSHAVSSGRQRDVMIFSLPNPYISSTFNPFMGGTPEQITERFFSAHEFSNEYYKDIQFSAFRSIVALLQRRGERPMPGVLFQLLQDKKKLQAWCEGVTDTEIKTQIDRLVKLSEEDFNKNFSGIVTALSHFSSGDLGKLFNTRNPEIELIDAIRREKIIYFQLPTNQFAHLGKATGKLVLQCLSSAVSELQVSGFRSKRLFSVFLDDFNDYMYEGFESLLNKSRSCNVGVVFSHQSIGDLDKVSPEFTQIVMTNTNTKIVMQSNDPDSAERFANIIGTISTEKTTERRSWFLFGSKNTGEKSVREAEEYVVHPNAFKSQLAQGEGIVIMFHAKGQLIKRLLFSPVETLPALTIPIRDLPMLDIARESTYGGIHVKTASKPARRNKKDKEIKNTNKEAA